jgi:hypothetical protein
MKVEINPDIDGITTVVFSVCSEKMTADQFYESVTEGLLYEKYGTMIKPVVPPKNVSKA